MITQLEAAIAAMADKASAVPGATEAMQFAQAACNLANALITVKNAKNIKEVEDPA